MAITSALWAFMETPDKKKLTKAGFATPRGGGKNAYQNHVDRSNRVIVPFEKRELVDPGLFENGVIYRVLPDQYFASAGEKREDFPADIEPGVNAFVLYRTRLAMDSYPPPEGWTPRGLVKDGEVVLRRSRGATDTGHYVVRINKQTDKEEAGLAQGIFAPEYATPEDNVRSQAVLAWLITQTKDSPYTEEQAEAIKTALDSEDAALLDLNRLERLGILEEGVTSCPLCGKQIRHDELHSTLDLTEASALANAAIQIEDATRSTIVNLFHMQPLLYGKELHHKPEHVAWGHAVCNTLLGQRRCLTLDELKEEGTRLKTADDSEFAWASADEEMLRSDDGGVWIKLVSRDHSTAPLVEEVGEQAIEHVDEDSDVAK
jgi:hypothetical protein